MAKDGTAPASVRKKSVRAAGGPASTPSKPASSVAQPQTVRPSAAGMGAPQPAGSTGSTQPIPGIPSTTAGVGGMHAAAVPAVAVATTPAGEEGVCVPRSGWDAERRLHEAEFSVCLGQEVRALLCCVADRLAARCEEGDEAVARAVS